MNPGHALRSARRRAGLTQRALARVAGVPQPTVARIESGAVNPRTDTFSLLLRAAGHETFVEPRLGQGIDRSLIRDRLRLTPAERIRLAVDEARSMPRIAIRR